MGLLAGYAFWRWWTLPTLPRAVLAGLALGLAELTKFTWLILFALWPLLLLIQFARERSAARHGNPLEAAPQGGHSHGEPTRWERIVQLGALLFLCVCLINVGYLCEGSLTPLKEYDFASESLAGPREARGGPMGNRFRGTWLGEVPVPLPYHYLSGIDIQKVDFERDWRCYLAGTWKQGGWWYFYLVALAVKLPLGTLGLGVLAAVFALRRPDRRTALLDQLPLLLPPLAVLILASSQTHFTTHVRYVLPAFPFAFVWLSQLVSPAAASVSKWYPRLAWSCLAATVVSSALAVPHSLSYFNELAGGSANGHRWLLNSNVDWGQDLLFARDWLKRHAPGRPFGLIHFGFYDARLLGLENYSLPPEYDEERPPANSTSADGPQPGLYVLSVNALHGHEFYSSDGRGGMKLIDRPVYSYFQRLEPVARIGGSMVIYDVSLEETNRLRRELNLPAIAE